MKLWSFPPPLVPVIEKKGNFLYATQSNRYQWYKDGEKIEDAVGQSFYAEDVGAYYVKTLDSNLCTSFSDIYNIEVKKDEIKISPNPAREEILLEIYLKKSTFVKFTVFDSQGKLVKKTKINVAKGYITKNLNINNIAIGEYNLIVETQYRKLKAKFIKY